MNAYACLYGYISIRTFRRSFLSASYKCYYVNESIGEYGGNGDRLSGNSIIFGTESSNLILLLGIELHSCWLMFKLVSEF